MPATPVFASAASPPALLKRALRLALIPLSASFPCPACERGPAGPEGVCDGCLATLFSPLHLPGLVALGYYRGGLRRLVRAYKFAGARRLAAPLARALAAEVEAAGWEPALVTHVPLHRERKRRRGFDQAALLARSLASLLGLPFDTLLVRHELTGEQSRLEPGERVRNVANAFRPASASLDGGRGVDLGRVLLVDDVHTTGATTGACRSALESAGARHVKLAVVALAPKRSPFS